MNTKYKYIIWFSISLALLLSASFAKAATGASFGLSPASVECRERESFPVTLYLNSGTVPINAAQAIIQFPPKKLRVVEISTQDSIFKFWPQIPTWSNSKGEISFAGGLPTPGFKGNYGKIFTIRFKAVGLGKAELSFKNEMVLANAPLEKNVFSFSKGGVYLVGPGVPEIPNIISLTHPDSQKWYNNSSPQFQWKIAPDVVGLNFAFNQDAHFEPKNLSQGLFRSRMFQGVKDGVWYFHLKLKNNVGWGATAHFRVQIDTSPPRPFEITIDNQGDPTNPSPMLYFETADEMSGIAYYEVEIGKEDTLELRENGGFFQIPPHAPGLYLIRVKAVDKAQNFTQASAKLKIEPIESPHISISPKVFIAGEEVLYIEGSALPNCKTTVYLKKKEKVVKKWEVSSDDNGKWFLRENKLLRPGLYTILAQAKDLRGAISNFSDPKPLTIVFSGITVGHWMITYKILTWILLVVFGLMLIGILGLLWRVLRTRARVERETQDLKHKFYKEYYEFRNVLIKELEFWQKHEPGGNQHEKEKREKLLKELNDIKTVLEREVKDIR